MLAGYGAARRGEVLCASASARCQLSSAQLSSAQDSGEWALVRSSSSASADRTCVAQHDGQGVARVDVSGMLRCSAHSSAAVRQRVRRWRSSSSVDQVVLQAHGATIRRCHNDAQRSMRCVCRRTRRPMCAARVATRVYVCARGGLRLQRSSAAMRQHELARVAEGEGGRRIGARRSIDCAARRAHRRELAQLSCDARCIARCAQALVSTAHCDSRIVIVIVAVRSILARSRSAAARRGRNSACVRRRCAAETARAPPAPARRPQR